MAYTVFLDANVLYPQLVCHVLLQLAERRLFRVAWSEGVLEEVRRNLAPEIGEDAINRRIAMMRDAFPEAEGPAHEPFLGAVPSAVDDGDQHVVAAALAARADALVTNNTRDFAPDELFALGIEVQTLDQFLVNQLHLDGEAVLEALNDVSEDLSRPPMTVREILDSLAERGAPQFAVEARDLLFEQ